MCPWLAIQVDDFARAWANLYSIRVLSVIGAYTDPRLNIQEQVRDQLVVTRIVPWTLGFLLSVNFTYAVLGMVVGALAWAVSTKEVLALSKKMDLNRQLTERYGGEEISRGKDRGRASMAEMIPQRHPHSGLRVGVIEEKFESLLLAVWCQVDLGWAWHREVHFLFCPLDNANFSLLTTSVAACCTSAPAVGIFVILNYLDSVCISRVDTVHPTNTPAFWPFLLRPVRAGHLMDEVLVAFAFWHMLLA
jgi:hypothetical protein